MTPQGWSRGHGVWGGVCRSRPPVASRHGRRRRRDRLVQRSRPPPAMRRAPLPQPRCAGDRGRQQLLRREPRGARGTAGRPVAQATNLGFAHGVNAGWRRGRSPTSLLLNPDARIAPASVAALVRVLETEPDAGLAAPRILHEDGSLDHSQRRFPRLRSTYAQALFLHRLRPAATWTDAGRPRSPGLRGPRPARVGIGSMPARAPLHPRGAGRPRRALLPVLRGQGPRPPGATRGRHVVFEPAAIAVHTGGASTPAAGCILPATSRIAYAGRSRRRGGRVEHAGSAWSPAPPGRAVRRPCRAAAATPPPTRGGASRWRPPPTAGEGPARAALTCAMKTAVLSRTTSLHWEARACNGR